MFGKRKEIVSLAYKEKLLAEIAHYEKRIDEALHKRRQTSYEDESPDEDRNMTNPYKLNIRQSGFELKQQEASISDRASMTLELAMLTIMQSEVNVMVTPPEVRRPVEEDGIWQEVVAECKIDLVSFTITFYAHKPYRRFAPVRYRNVTVELVKPAHQKELAQSVLPKLNRPNLALQVLQSYATAFRSRRTTLLELAQRYEDKLRMEAMPEGGYRVKFLNLLQVEWTLENLWSPIVPFCHRMKFEVEYMPKDYIHTIGKLYKQFKDPSLETSERTSVLARIFDTCLQAQGLAREIQESFESDPETAGRLHERRTTIDQEPDVPRVEHSPQKPKGKENKAHNRKTTMAPPKTIPKKAKKVDAKSKDKENEVESLKGVQRGIEDEETNVAKKLNTEEISENRNSVKHIENNASSVAKKTNPKENVIENRKGVKKGIEDNTNATKKSTGKKGNGDTDSAKDDVDENRKGVKRGIENDSTNTAKKPTAKDGTDNRKGVKRGIANDVGNNAKKSRIDEGNVNSKSKPGLKGGKDGIDDNGEIETVSSKNKAQKKVSGKNVKDNDMVNIGTTENNALKKGNYESVKTKSISEKPVGSKELKKGNKEKDNLNAKNNEDTASKKSTTKSAAKNNEKGIAGPKSTDVENNIESSKKDAEDITKTKNVATLITNANKDKGDVISSKHGTKKAENAKNAASKDEKTVSGGGVSKSNTPKAVEAQNVANTEHKGTRSDHTKAVNKVNSKTVVSKETVAKPKTLNKNMNKEDVPSNKATKHGAKEVNPVEKVAKTSEVVEKTKEHMNKHAAPKDANKVKSKEVVKDIVNKKNIDNGNKKDHGNKETNVKVTSKVTEKGKGVKETLTENKGKITDNEKNKETTQSMTEKTKVLNPKTAGQKSAHDKNSKTTADRTSKAKVTDKNNEIIAKKSIATQPDARQSKNKNYDKQVKQSTTDKKENDNNINSKLSQNANNILKEKTNEKNTNILNVTVTKAKNVPITKLQAENQMKLADKLKTKIPMMKSKLKISALRDKLLVNNMGRLNSISGVEKTKIPQKSLPVFKKVVKNLPTRISPRKLPSTFNPSSRGFSNK